MPNSSSLIAQLYAAFNRRDVESALAPMSEDVSWPKASEGGRIVGKGSIREYWQRQWAEFDPHVEPLEILQPDPGSLHVRVHQLVRTLSGEVLSDSEVWHLFMVDGGRVLRMDLGHEPGSSEHSATSAFAKHPSPDSNH